MLPHLARGNHFDGLIRSTGMEAADYCSCFDFSAERRAGAAATALEDNAELLRTMLESERDGHGGAAENGQAGPRPSNGAEYHLDVHAAPQQTARQQGLKDRCGC